MSLDILESIVHNCLDVCRSTEILAEQEWIVFECFCFNFPYDVATLGNVPFKLTAGLIQA